MLLLKKWLGDPLNLVVAVFALLAIIWPRMFLFLLIACFLAVFPRYFRGWLYEKFDQQSQRHPKIFVAFAVPFGMFAAYVLFVNLPNKLWVAWNTGVIEGRQRWGPDPVYSRFENPGGYWLTFGIDLFVIAFFLMLALISAYLLWTGRNAPIRRNKLLGPGPPMEATPEDRQ
jgi:uncharacterized protein YggT (Ycf19 family)